MQLPYSLGERQFFFGERSLMHRYSYAASFFSWKFSSHGPEEPTVWQTDSSQAYQKSNE